MSKAQIEKGMNKPKDKSKSINIISDERPVNPLLHASIYSRLCFGWVSELLTKGRANVVKEIDVPHIGEQDTSVYNRDLIERIWREEVERVEKYNNSTQGKKKKKKRPNLHRAMLLHFFKSLWILQILYLIDNVFRVFQGIALGFLIETFVKSDEDDTASNPKSLNDSGYFWAGMLVLSGAIVLFVTHQHFFITWRKGNQLKHGTIAAIYSKSLRLRSIGGVDEKSISSGNIVNLATNDAERFLLAALFVSYLFWAPAQALAVLVIGIYMVGPAFAAGYVILFCSVPLQFYLGRRFAILRSKIAKITDSRITLVAQAVSGVRVMKMSGWESQFSDRIAKVRGEEMQQIQSANHFKALNEAVFFFTNIVIVIIIFVVHVATGGVITPRNVFTTMTLINIVTNFMAKFFSLGVMGVSECYVSISRLQKFLELPELSHGLQKTKENVAQEQVNSNKIQPILSMSDVVCYWDIPDTKVQPKETPTNLDVSNGEDTDKSSSEDGVSAENIVALHDININFFQGKLYCIIGPVGCGKSALIQSIAGELPPSEGKICRNYSSLAYASQDPWIMNGSIKENITLGLDYEGLWYNEVVNACGLSVDFKQFIDGDETIVGDRGVQCSGGQKARIALARALYRNADVLLLDDPLSAVDSKVGHLIFYSAIQDLCVKRGKCVILATHQHQFIGDSECLLMSRGKVKFMGSFADCVQNSEGALVETTQRRDNEEGKESSMYEEKGNANDSIKETPEYEETSLTNEKKAAKNKADHEEMNTTGEVRRSTWLEYARAMGGIWVAIMILLLLVAAQAGTLVTIATIGKWAEVPPLEQSSSEWTGLVLGLGALVIFLAIIRALFAFFFTIKASQRLHDKMTSQVMRAKIEFFDTNPLGRILNRFSADVGVNDDQLPTTLFDFLVCAGIVLGGVATSVSVLPITLLAVPPLLWYFMRLRRTFLSTSRELKRIEGVTRSPIHAMLNESLNGIATIRSNAALGYTQERFESLHDSNIRAFFIFIASSRWLGFRLDLILFYLVALCSFLAVLFNEQGWFKISPAILGLALTMLLQLIGTFQWCVRQSAEVVNQMVSVERVSAFSHIPSEADLVKDEDKKDPTWPSKGAIEVSDLVIRYRASLPPSLSGVSFEIKSGQRVGIVGRTGCGKSTLVQALFRILEAEEGTVKIDGIDISSLGLHKVRTEMSVIPQYPVLFSGCTIRDNLDPFGKYDESTIRQALEDVQMWEAVKELPEGLNSLVAEGGSNFSVGQRQLICLARAILRKNKILVLDEPTANVDSKTDHLLQKAVAESFSGSTIIAVAHRLDTIIGYDLIIVLGSGKLLEIGSPRELLSINGGHFSSMVDDTGEKTAKMLRNIAFGQGE